MIQEITSPITPIGYTNARGGQKKFGIKIDDRRRHIYIVGKTGVGKSTLLENMAIADIQSGKGIAIIDPHGELAEKLLHFVPEERLDDVIYFDPSDMENPIAFNPMEQVGTEFRHLVASGIMGVFKKIWPDAWSARMEYILNNTLLSLLELPGSTLLGILRMFSEKDYRKKIVDNLKDPVIKAFWQKEFANYTQRLESEALAAIQNKVGQFVSNPLIRNILGQSRSTLNMREIMDTGKIFIVNLSKGKMGEDNSALLGAMIISRLQLAAMSRVDVPEEKRRDFFMYVDEFQNFATESFAGILSEARKYHLSITLAHQYIGQLVTSDGNTKVRDAVFGNVGTIITFRIGAADAEFLEKEFMPEFLQQDLVNLAKANIYTKLMIDGVASRPFSALTLPPQSHPLISYRDVIIKNSQERYGTPRTVVEEKIAGEWLTPTQEIVTEKVGRKDERRLSEVLRPDAQAQRSRPRFDGGGDNYGGTPRYDVPADRQDDDYRPLNTNTNANQNKPRFQQPPPSGPRPAQRPPTSMQPRSVPNAPPRKNTFTPPPESAPTNDLRDAIRSQLRSNNEPEAVEKPVAPTRASASAPEQKPELRSEAKPEPKAEVKPQPRPEPRRIIPPPIKVRDLEYPKFVADSDEVREIRPEAKPRDNYHSAMPGPAARHVAAEKPVEPDTADLVDRTNWPAAPRAPKPEPREERMDHVAQRPSTSHPMHPGNHAGEKPRQKPPTQHKQFPKPTINIDELRKAIHDSLDNPQEGR